MRNLNGNTFSFIPHVCYFSYHSWIAASEDRILTTLFSSTKLRESGVGGWLEVYVGVCDGNWQTLLTFVNVCCSFLITCIIRVSWTAGLAYFQDIRNEVFSKSLFSSIEWEWTRNVIWSLNNLKFLGIFQNAITHCDKTGKYNYI